MLPLKDGGGALLQVKQEWWWLYIGDRKSHSLITAPVQLCSLKTEEEVPLQANLEIYVFALHIHVE